MSKRVYEYSVWFTDSPHFPWKWAIYVDGQLVVDYPSLRYTGSTVTRWGAHWAAWQYIRRHRKHKDPYSPAKAKRIKFP